MRRLWMNFEEALGSVLLVAICGIAALQVTSRYILVRPFAWTEELATYLFVYLTCVGAALALKRHEHFALEVIVDHLPDKIALPLKLIVTLLVFVASCIIFWFGCRLTVQGWNVTTPTLEISSSIPYAAVPLGGLLMMIRSSEIFIRLGKKVFVPKTT